MAFLRPTVTVPLAAVVCVLVLVSVAATPGVAVGESLATTAAQDSSAVEASLAPDRSTRRLLQQRFRNDGFDPGTPDGPFGPRTRAAIRAWQESRGASPTGYWNGPEAELLRTAAAPAPPEALPPPQGVAAVDPNASSAGAAPASTSVEPDPSSASPATVAAEEVDDQNRAEPNTQPPPRVAGDGTVQLPPEILLDRHLLRVDRLLAADDYGAALAMMDDIIALQQHDLQLPEDSHFSYAEAALPAGLVESAIASLNDYVITSGSDGDLYREALQPLDTAEEALRQAEAERRQADRARQPAEAQQRSHAELVQRQLAAGERPLPRDALRSGGLGPEMVTNASGRLQYPTRQYPGDTHLWVIFDRPFAISTYEVMRGEIETFVDRTRHHSEARRNPNYGCQDQVSRNRNRRNSSLRRSRPRFDQTQRQPVTCVSIRDAMAYARWLSEETGHDYRLPSAAEWQYAMRPGSEKAQLYIEGRWSASDSCGRANLVEREHEDARNRCLDGVRYTPRLDESRRIASEFMT